MIDVWLLLKEEKELKVVFLWSVRSTWMTVLSKLKASVIVLQEDLMKGGSLSEGLHEGN